MGLKGEKKRVKKKVCGIKCMRECIILGKRWPRTCFYFILKDGFMPVVLYLYKYKSPPLAFDRFGKIDHQGLGRKGKEKKT